MARTIGSAQLSTLLQLKAGLDLAHPVADVTIVPEASITHIAVPIAGADGRSVAHRLVHDRARSLTARPAHAGARGDRIFAAADRRAVGAAAG
ncbi:MAG: hypothetical protein WDN44_16300 [Sphingomonas sp.]